MLSVQDFKELYDFLKKSANIEMQEKFMQMREEMLELREGNLALKESNRELENEIKKKGKLEFDGSVYWVRLENNSMDGPYCQRCQDVDNRLVRLQVIRPNQRQLYMCNECKGYYDKHA